MNEQNLKQFLAATRQYLFGLTTQQMACNTARQAN
jgi:hypothetical protein